MITDIHLENYHLKFNNSRKELVECPVSDGYNGVFTYLQCNDELICILIWDENSTNEQCRRNVIKIDENGRTVWVIQDHLEIWVGKIKPNDPDAWKTVEKMAFSGISRYEDWFNDPNSVNVGRLMVWDSVGRVFFLNPATGGIEFWKAGKY